MTRYRIAENWGGGEVTSAVACDCIFTVPDGWTLVERDGGEQAMVPTSYLTEVPPPIPAEPEPGAYLIGENLAQRLEEWPEDDGRWRAAGHEDWMTWTQLWAASGGPDVAIVPLVPAPEVELPWGASSQTGAYRLGVTLCSNPTASGAANISIDDWIATATADTAESMAHALLSAARAAREASNG